MAGVNIHGCHHRRKVPFILQWNCAGIISRLAELKIFLKETRIPVLALSEAGLPSGRSLPGYVAHKNCSIKSFPNGSAALYIRREIPHVSLDVTDLCTDAIEVTAVRIQLGTRSLSVASVYVSARKKVALDAFMEQLCDRCPAPRIICGDFNAHHPVWGDRNTDSRGRLLVDIIDNLDLCVANDGSPTFFRPPTSATAIDLTLHSTDVRVKWSTGPDRMGSDHFPIFVFTANFYSRGSRISHVVNWDKYRQHLDSVSGDIIGKMLSSKAAATSTVKVPDHFPAPDLKLRNLCAARRRAERQLMRKKEDISLKTAFNRLNSAIRRHTNKLYRMQWASFCSSLTVFSPMPRIWRAIGSLAGDLRPSRTFEALALRQQKPLASLAEDFADVFMGTSSGPGPCLPLVLSTSLMDAPFTLRELQTALSGLRRRCSPGPDGITNQMLRNLPCDHRRALLDYFNQVWETGTVPPSWKMACVVPVLKPGKAMTNLASYRPVSLTSCVAKLMEKLANVRLTWWLEETKALPSCMTGFRPGLSAQDSILDLVSHIEHQRAFGLSTLAIFLDVTKAYDSVLQSSILTRLQSMGVQGNLLKFIYSFICDRSMQVRLGSTLSSERAVSRGVPQGSVLSPTLFNVALAGLPAYLKNVHRQIRMSIYADDICIWFTGYQHKRLALIACHVLHSVREYLDGVGLSISAEKSGFVLFPGIGRRHARLQIDLDSFRIRQFRHTRFLGVVLDSRLQWRRTVDSMVSSLLPRLNAIRRIASHQWGNHPSSMVRVHDALVVSRIMYQLPLIFPSTSQYDRLETLHRKCLRRALGVPQAAANNLVLHEALSKPLRLLASQRLLLQIGRLAGTVAGRALLQRLRQRSESRVYLALATLRALGLSFRRRRVRLNPPWSVESLECTLSVPRVHAKRSAPLAETRSLVLEHLEKEYGNYLYVFTDGSVDKARGASSAAFHIPSVNMAWSARLMRVVSPTTAESVAIEAALRKLKSFPAQPVVILTDSKSALQRLEHGFPSARLTLRSLNLVQHLRSKGFHIRFQWVPSHIGILGNEMADSLAHEALLAAPSRKVPQDELTMFRETVHNHFRTIWSPPHQPCVTQGLKRYQASLLYRIRTGSARTPAWMHKTGLAISPLCPSCGVRGDIEHFVLCCPIYHQERLVLLASLERAAVPRNTLDDIVYPRGQRSLRKVASRLLLQYLHDTDLDTQW